ncbi:hypothetical protein [Actinocorallia aurea]
MLVPVVIAAGTLWAAYYLAPAQEERNRQAEAERGRQGPPLRVSLESSWDIDTDSVFLFENPLSSSAAKELKHPSGGSQEIVDFAERHGALRVGAECLTSACDTSRTRFKITFTGLRTTRLRITQIAAEILARRPSPSGSAVLNFRGGGGPVEGGVLVLDSGESRLLALDEFGKAGRPYFDVKTVGLEREEPITFEIFALSSTDAIEWQLVVDVETEGRSERMTVRADGGTDGKPFLNPGRIRGLAEYETAYDCQLFQPPRCDLFVP